MQTFIHPSARIGSGTQCGYNAVIEQDVVIGAGCRIGHGVILHQGTRIGENVRIDDHTVVGKLPMKAALSAITTEQPLPPCKIADHVLVGALSVLYRGCRLAPHVMVADLASIREDVEIGEYTIIGRGVAIENHVRIGQRCKIETGAYITALSMIGDSCFVAPEVTFTNDNFLGRTRERFQFHKGVTLLRGARVGANATILPGVCVGADALIAAGAVVTHDVPGKTIVCGMPARPLRAVPPAQLLENQ